MRNENPPVPGDFEPCALPLRQLCLPPAGTVHLWFFDLGKLGNPLQPDSRQLSAPLSPRQQRTLRRFYLRLLLGAYLGVPGKEIAISRQVRGKPVLKGFGDRERLDFSITSSDGCGLVAVAAAGLVGVDLEMAGRAVGDPVGLARRYFSPAEAAALAATEPGRLNQAFLHTWACKEALVKAAGHGIANQLDRFTVSCVPDAPATVLAMQDDDPEAWRLAMVKPSEQHIGAVALRSASLELEPFQLVPRG
jgi:4'-phosphopantetheinyl transferase